MATATDPTSAITDPNAATATAIPETTAAIPATTTAAPATGLINTTAGTALPANPAATYTPTQATAANWTVNPNQTVQSQVQDVINNNSPLMQQAQTRALQQANARGLLNSSIAVGEGQNAVLNAALPIATADAATQARAAELNAGAQQQAVLANQNAFNTQGQFGASEANKITQLGVQQQSDLARIAASGAVTQKLAEFNAGAAKDLAGIEAQYKGLTQASSSAASVMNTTIAAISRIMEDTTLDAAGKQKAIDTYNTNAKVSLGIIGSLAGNVQLGNFMDAVLA